jgi:4-nitrophenyl phosphatase
MAIRLTTREEYERLIDKYDTFLFDCNGVLWDGNSVVNGVTDVLGLLRSKSTCASGVY